MGVVESLGAPVRTTSDLLTKLQSPFLLFIRVYVAWVFLKSGMHKIGDWELTLTLFEYEYNVPLLNYELAAYLATFGELVFPVAETLPDGTETSACVLISALSIGVVRPSR